MPKRILVVFGTRPEAIKLGPVVAALRACPAQFQVKTLSTGQHREMLQQYVELFELAPDFDLSLMRPDQQVGDVVASVLCKLNEVFSVWRPDWVLIQGDTATAFATAVACFYAAIPCGHVEAGLRTGDFQAPWPEEMHRVLLAPLMSANFAPTERAKRNLLHEHIAPRSILVTGNTVIDALLTMLRKIEADQTLAQSISAKFAFLDGKRRLILVTGHRRENFGKALQSLCEAMRKLARRADVQLVYAVHLNPKVRDTVYRVLEGTAAVLIEPQDYLPFIYLMNRAAFIITDSGGIQEEAPSLGKPVLVTRDKTERVEAIEAGTVKLVGTDGERLYREAVTLLDDPDAYARMAHTANPYGNGHASDRIRDWLAAA
jgi:UDP-N-acetylglucosamine 2-epimerase (non-hydrolysing)